MTDILDQPTFACDECSCPTALVALVPYKKQHICSPCYRRIHELPEIKDPVKVLDALYNFAFGDPEDAFTMPLEQVEAELREAGIDPDEVERRVRARLAEIGVRLPEGTKR